MVVVDPSSNEQQNSDTENGISSFITNSCKTKYISRPSGGVASSSGQDLGGKHDSIRLLVQRHTDQCTDIQTHGRVCVCVCVCLCVTGMFKNVKFVQIG